MLLWNASQFALPLVKALLAEGGAPPGVADLGMGSEFLNGLNGGNFQSFMGRALTLGGALPNDLMPGDLIYIPEPSTWWLLAAGILAVGGALRVSRIRRKTRSHGPAPRDGTGSHFPHGTITTVRTCC